MNIHEYQAKELLKSYGVPVPAGEVVYSDRAAARVAEELGGVRWVVKAQIHAGGRGKGGGVKVANSVEKVAEVADQMIGSTLITAQTGPEGKRVHRVLVERASRIDREFYLSMIVDRTSQKIVVIVSAEGGVEIEEVAAERPEAIHTEYVDPGVGLLDFQCRKIATSIGLANRAASFTRLLKRIYRLFRDKDCLLLEINPFIVTEDGDLIALDCKMQFDDNALYRQAPVAELRDFDEEDPKEVDASGHGLNYVALDGNVGCIVNGAGLAMGTMDAIVHHGGRPANFLDVGGGASPEKIANAFRIVLTDPNVEAILVNIFAGINRCDWIAQGIVQATRDQQIGVPGDRASRRHERRGRPSHPDGIRSRRDPGRRPGRCGGKGRRRRLGGRGMSVFVDKDSKVIIQGFTGQHATFHAEESIRFGTKVVGGVTPGKGGRVHLGLPVFNSVAEAVEETGATVSGIFVPPAIATDSLLEAVEAGIQIAVIIADGVPVQDMVRTKRYLAGRSTTIIGPNSPGIITPGECKVGIMPSHIYLPGRVGVVSRSGTLNYEAVSQMTALGLGQSSCVGIGGDPVNGTDFKTVLQAFENDDDTDVVVMIGEIGGQQEVEAATWASQYMAKPLVCFIAGMSAPRGRRMGHAGAVIAGDADTATAKLDAIEALGHRVVRNPAEIGDTVLRAVKEAGQGPATAS